MFYLSLFTTILAALHISSVTSAAAGTGGPAGCVTFDANWNLLAFGFNSKDYNVGTQDMWSTGKEDRSRSSRCLLASSGVLTKN